jgi:hypothetical protein
VKIKINETLVKNIAVYAVLLILVFFSTTGLLFNASSEFLKDTLNLSLSNLGLVTGIKILSGTVDFLKGIQDIVEKIFNYFLAINGLILFQATLLKLSNMIFFRVMIILVSFACIFKSLRKISLKILLILLFINPGLQIYVLGVKFISNQANLEMGKSINSELQNISQSMNAANKDSGESVSEDTSGVSFSDRIKNFFSTGINKTKEFLGKTADNLMKTSNKILELVINYFVSMMILFLILPVIYFLVLYLIFKKFFILNK